ncbi:MAG: hypothetical protein FWG10_13000 [Eubacteriaceae bacterium]|nr:hypothetical protein [Eubacteriaceae bacterium]
MRPKGSPPRYCPKPKFIRTIKRLKRNENIVSVKTLIDACPNFPTYDSVKSGNRNITNRIIEPFERDLLALSPAIEWEYKNIVGRPPRGYEEFIGAKIVVHWLAYPDVEKLEAGKKKRAKNQKKASKARA